MSNAQTEQTQRSGFGQMSQDLFDALTYLNDFDRDMKGWEIVRVSSMWDAYEPPTVHVSTEGQIGGLVLKELLLRVDVSCIYEAAKCWPRGVFMVGRCTA